MTDPQVTNQGIVNTSGTSTGGSVVSDDGIVIDKNKTQEQYIAEAEAKYIIPALVREKFPDLVKLIYETESMNGEEREYWMQIMPIMTEKQIVDFRNILVKEKDQLAKLDAEYNQEVSRINQDQAPIDEAKLKEKLQSIQQAESQHNKVEEAEESALLEQLKNM